MNHTKETGEVFLVGAGPGAADLITLRGLKALQTAEVVVYDRLVSHELLEQVPVGCEHIYVGKRKNLHVMTQEKICQVLIEKAAAGKRVVRLKGGDPFVFGRGGEEIDALIEAGITWQIIPGVTAASGVAASVGMPLTHREESQALTLVTAHRKDGSFNLDWPLVLHNHQTVAFYMALSCASELVCELLQRGKPADTPFTIVASGTRKDEQSATCLLAEANDMLEDLEFASPALLVLGPRPRKTLDEAWFDDSEIGSEFTLEAVL